MCSYRGIWLHVHMLILATDLLYKQVSQFGWLHHQWPETNTNINYCFSSTDSTQWELNQYSTFNLYNFIFKFYELIVVHTLIVFHKCIFPGMMSSWQQCIVYSPLNRATANFCIRRALFNINKIETKQS